VCKQRKSPAGFLTKFGRGGSCVYLQLTTVMFLHLAQVKFSAACITKRFFLQCGQAICCLPIPSPIMPSDKRKMGSAGMMPMIVAANALAIRRPKPPIIKANTLPIPLVKPPRFFSTSMISVSFLMVFVASVISIRSFTLSFP
jgi:hypothetical protein